MSRRPIASNCAMMRAPPDWPASARRRTPSLGTSALRAASRTSASSRRPPLRWKPVEPIRPGRPTMTTGNPWREARDCAHFCAGSRSVACDLRAISASGTSPLKKTSAISAPGFSAGGNVGNAVDAAVAGGPDAIGLPSAVLLRDLVDAGLAGVDHVDQGDRRVVGGRARLQRLPAEHDEGQHDNAKPHVARAEKTAVALTAAVLHLTSIASSEPPAVQGPGRLVLARPVCRVRRPHAIALS